MIIPTENGSIALDELNEPSDCVCCGREGLGMAHVVSVAAEQDKRAEMHWCGTCLSAAMAIYLASQIERRGGMGADPPD